MTGLKKATELFCEPAMFHSWMSVAVVLYVTNSVLMVLLFFLIKHVSVKSDPFHTVDIHVLIVKCEDLYLVFVHF